MTFILILGFVLFSYFIGSISSAVVISYLFGLPDPRQAGSGNPGATNVLRLGGKWPAVLTLLGDVFKGWICVVLAKLFLVSPWGVGLVALSAFLGHLYPIYFKFVGGKGVATFFGVLLALHPLLALNFLGVWLVVAFLVKISSVSSLVASFLSVGLMYYLMGGVVAFFGLVMVVWLFFRHRANLCRLTQGKEPRIGKKA